MRNTTILLILLSFNTSYSQDDHKTLLEGTFSGQPFELRQVTQKLDINIVSAGFDPISKLNEIPKTNIFLLTHNHYDHQDMSTIRNFPFKESKVLKKSLVAFKKFLIIETNRKIK